jgi:hypothetical protein
MIEDYLLDYYQTEPKDELEITVSNCYSGVQATEALPSLVKYLLTKLFKPDYEL